MDLKPNLTLIKIPRAAKLRPPSVVWRILIIQLFEGLLELPNLGNNQIMETPWTAMLSSAAIWQPSGHFSSQMEERCRNVYTPLKRKSLNALLC